MTKILIRFYDGRQEIVTEEQALEIGAIHTKFSADKVDKLIPINGKQYNVRDIKGMDDMPATKPAQLPQTPEKLTKAQMTLRHKILYITKKNLDLIAQGRKKEVKHFTVVGGKIHWISEKQANDLMAKHKRNQLLNMPNVESIVEVDGEIKVRLKRNTDDSAPVAKHWQD